MKLIIGNRAYSSWSMRGWLALKHAGLEFEELVVPMFDEAWEQRREGDEFAPSLGKVPILWDSEIVVWDSLAIIEFLADRYGRELYWPEDEEARGMARSMAAEISPTCRSRGSFSKRSSEAFAAAHASAFPLYVGPCINAFFGSSDQNASKIWRVAAVAASGSVPPVSALERVMMSGTISA